MDLCVHYSVLKNKRGWGEENQLCNDLLSSAQPPPPGVADYLLKTNTPSLPLIVCHTYSFPPRLTFVQWAVVRGHGGALRNGLWCVPMAVPCVQAESYMKCYALHIE